MQPIPRSPETRPSFAPNAATVGLQHHEHAAENASTAQGGAFELREARVVQPLSRRIARARSAWLDDTPELALADLLGGEGEAAVLRLGPAPWRPGRAGLATHGGPVLADAQLAIARIARALPAELANRWLGAADLPAALPSRASQDLFTLAERAYDGLAVLQHDGEHVGAVAWVGSAARVPHIGPADDPLLAEVARVVALQSSVERRPDDADAWAALLDLLPGPAFFATESGDFVVSSIAARLAHPVRPRWVSPVADEGDLPIGVRHHLPRIGRTNFHLWQQDPALAEVSIHHGPWTGRWNLDPALGRVAAGLLVGHSVGAMTVRLGWAPAQVVAASAEVLRRAGVSDPCALRMAMRSDRDARTARP